MSGCPVCDFDTPEEWHLTKKPPGLYHHCPRCDFIWKNQAERLSFAEERVRYDDHQNGSEGHRDFLKPLIEALLQIESPMARGLDWGSGPVPILQQLLEEQGRTIENYDLHYQNEKPALESFDFIACCEVIEHFQDPTKDFAEMILRLRPGGRLYVMTSLNPGMDSTQFADWSYRRDPTHVGFHSQKSFQLLCEKFDLTQSPRPDSIADRNSKGLRWVLIRSKSSRASG